MVFNVMEEIVRFALDEMFSDGYEGCRCELCRNDILAIALNRLPPQYSVSQTGEAYIKAKLFADQCKVDVIRELTRASDIVQKRKRHP